MNFFVFVTQPNLTFDINWVRSYSNLWLFRRVSHLLTAGCWLVLVEKSEKRKKRLKFWRHDIEPNDTQKNDKKHTDFQHNGNVKTLKPTVVIKAIQLNVILINVILIIVILPIVI